MLEGKLKIALIDFYELTSRIFSFLNEDDKIKNKIRIDTAESTSDFKEKGFSLSDYNLILIGLPGINKEEEKKFVNSYLDKDIAFIYHFYNPKKEKEINGKKVSIISLLHPRNAEQNEVVKFIKEYVEKKC
jgi:hypothetical protein